MSYTDYSIRSFQGGYDKNLTYLVTCMRTANQFLIDAAVPLAEVSSFINHRVNPVKRGVRQSLVVWFGGKPFR